MSQDASLQTLLAPPTEEAASSSTWESSESSLSSESYGFSANSLADRLLDEVFEEVEQILTGRASYTPAATDDDEPSFAPTEASLSTGLPLAVRLEEDSSSAERLTVTADEEDSSLLSIETPPPSSPLEQRTGGLSYDRLLLGLGGFSVLATLTAWGITQYLHWYPSTVAVAPAQPAPPAPAAATNSSDMQFAEYIQRSLQAIDQRSQPASRSTLATTGQTNSLTIPPVGNLPTVTIPGNPTSLPSAATATTTPTNGGLERILTASNPFAARATAIVPPVSPLPRVASQPTTSAATANRSLQAMLPSSSSLATAGLARTLVGVLDLGNKEASAALIEINGVTQRFRVGESIGSSGWTLVEVSNNQALIRRNGEVRSVMAGQSF
jgi:hypothetical protein